MTTITRYVSTDGSDAAAGTSSATAWATLAYAKTQVRALIAANPTSDIRVILGDGRHAVTDTLAFTSADSPAHPCRATWIAADGAAPVISGGVEVTTWTLHDAGNNIWVADFAADEFRQLYVDGTRCYRARRGSGLTDGAATSSGFTTTDAVTTYDNLTDVELLFRAKWYEGRVKIASAVASTSLTMATPAYTYHYAYAFSRTPLMPTDIENAYEILEANAEAGTFYLDRTADKIYLIPPDGVTDPNDSTVIVPQLETLASFSGAARVKFSGVLFQHATWLPTEGGFEDIQAMCVMEDSSVDFTGRMDHYGRMTPANITIEDSQLIEFHRCRMEKMGSHAISITDNSERVTLRGTVITDVSGSGVVVSNTRAMFKSNPARRITIDNCLVEYCGLEFPGCPGISAIYPQHLLVEHCEVRHQSYTGVSIGWGWGNAKHKLISPMVGNTLRNCYIHDCVTVMNDGGGVYLNGAQHGLLVEGNYFKGINPPSAGGAIYPDEGTWHATIRNNVTEDTFRWFQYHKCHGDFVVEDNHADTTDHFYLVHATPWGTSWTYADATVYNPASPTAAQQAIIDEAGLEAAYADIAE